MKLKLKYIIILIFLITAQLLSAQVVLRARGKWRERINKQDLVGGAGSDIVTPITSDPDEVQIRIRKTADPITTPWRLDIRKIDINWHSDLNIFVQRTPGGTGGGTISGGMSYLEILDMDQLFFTGTGSWELIPLQFQITGLTVSVGVDDYVTEIYYTLTEL